MNQKPCRCAAVPVFSWLDTGLSMTLINHANITRLWLCWLPFLFCPCFIHVYRTMHHDTSSNETPCPRLYWLPLLESTGQYCNAGMVPIGHFSCCSAFLAFCLIVHVPNCGWLASQWPIVSNAWTLLYNAPWQHVSSLCSIPTILLFSDSWNQVLVRRLRVRCKTVVLFYLLLSIKRGQCMLRPRDQDCCYSRWARVSAKVNWTAAGCSIL